MHFTEIFIRRPVLSMVVGAFMLLLGVAAFFNLPIREDPKVDETVVTITTTYAGAAPDLIQGFITAPIAEAVATTEVRRVVVSAVPVRTWAVVSSSVDALETESMIPRKVRPTRSMLSFLAVIEASR